jgi:hypothetical protein
LGRILLVPYPLVKGGMMDDPRHHHAGKVWRRAGSCLKREAWTPNSRGGSDACSKDRYSSGGSELPDASWPLGRNDTFLFAAPSFLSCGATAFWVTGFLYSEGANSVGSQGEYFCFVVDFCCRICICCERCERM